MTDMNDDAPRKRPDNGEKSRLQSSQDAVLSARLQQLGRTLTDLRKARELVRHARQEGEDNASRASAMARGFRLSSELVAGVVVGFVIGWGIDRWLSTTPWGMIVFVLLGFVAGVLNVMRSAGVQQANAADRSGNSQ